MTKDDLLSLLQRIRQSETMKRKLLFIFIDLILVFVSFMLMAWIKPATVRVVLPTYWVPFVFFSLIWLFISVFIGKYNLDEAKSGRDVYVPITITNFTILAIITIMVYAFKYVFYSRLMVFGTIGVASILEAVSYTHLTLPTKCRKCRSRWSPYH